MLREKRKNAPRTDLSKGKWPMPKALNYLLIGSLLLGTACAGISKSRSDRASESGSSSSSRSGFAAAKEDASDSGSSGRALDSKSPDAEPAPLPRKSAESTIRRSAKIAKPSLKPVVPPRPAAGLLTAGAWDDVANHDVFTKFVTGFIQQQPAVGSSHAMRSIPRTQLIVRLRGKDNQALQNVELRWKYSDGSSSKQVYVSKSDGSISLNSSWDRLPAGPLVQALIRAPGEMQNHLVTAPLKPRQKDLTLKVIALQGKKIKSLDLCLVIDCTGSMSDELRYLQTEIGAIVSATKKRFANLVIRLSLVVYRDQGDQYVSKRYDFQNDVTKFQELLGDQSADGGGDYPEAMDQALNDAASLSWTREQTARVCFLVADAPPHLSREGRTEFAIARLRKEGVVIYPLAASGVQSQAELVLRQAAFVTGGQYLFLTDDSGVGNKHAEPHIPFYDVEKLSDLMTRMILSELLGEKVPAKEADIIRSVRSSEIKVKVQPN
jgi:hypothetical protein